MLWSRMLHQWNQAELWPTNATYRSPDATIKTISTTQREKKLAELLLISEVLYISVCFLWSCMISCCCWGTTSIISCLLGYCRPEVFDWSLTGLKQEVEPSLQFQSIVEATPCWQQWFHPSPCPSGQTETVTLGDGLESYALLQNNLSPYYPSYPFASLHYLKKKWGELSLFETPSLRSGMVIRGRTGADWGLLLGVTGSLTGG